MKDLEEAGEPTEELKAQYDAEKAAVEDAVEAPFTVEKKEYVVCCDTMGQDKEIAPETIKYLEVIPFILPYFSKFLHLFFTGIH